MPPFNTPQIDTVTDETDLTAVVDLISQAVSEKEDAMQAQHELFATQQRVASERVRLSQQRTQQVQQSAAIQNETLSNMVNTMDRIEEIDGNLLLRVIEPVAGKFNKNFSRERLAQDLKRQQTKLDIVAAEDNLKSTVYNRQIEQTQAQLDAQKVQAAKETGEFADVVDLIQLHETGRTNVEAAREAIIADTSDENLQQLLDNKIISEQRYKKEKQLRADTKLQQRQNEIAAQLNELRLQSSKIENLSDTDLKNPEKTKGLSPQMIIEEQRNRANQKLAFQQLNLAVNAQKFNTAARTLSDEELDAQVKSGKLTEQERKKIANERESEQLKMESNRRVADAEVQAAMENAKQVYLTTTGSSKLRELSQQARQNDGTVETTIHGQKVTFTADEILPVLNERTKAEVEIAELNTTEAVSEPVMQSSMQILTRTLGITAPADASTQDIINATAEAEGLPPDVITPIKAAQSQLDAANNPKLDPVVRSRLRNKAAVLIKEAEQTAVDRRIARMDKSVQEHAREYYETGHIGSNEGATFILSTAGAVNEQVGVDSYDASLDIMRNVSLASSDSLFGGKEGDDAITVADLKDALDTTKSPAERIAVSITDAATHNQIAAPIVTDALLNVHSTAASMFDKQLAVDISSGALFDTAEGFNEVRIFQALQERNISLSDYLLAVRETTRKVAPQIVRPQGQQAHVMAAMNKLLFGDAPAATLANAIQTRTSNAYSTLIHANAQPQDFVSKAGRHFMQPP